MNDQSSVNPDLKLLPGSKELAKDIEIRDARVDEIPDLMPLLRAYCDFYECDPTDDGLMAFAEKMLTESRWVCLFIARDSDRAIGFAALAWKWSSLRGSLVGYLDDLYVHPDARGKGVADALISVCAERASEHGATALVWLTADDNHRAQAVYGRLGGTFGVYREYELEL
ncbi:MAG: N-acetyltransferase family protein [bacterium]